MTSPEGYRSLVGRGRSLLYQKRKEAVVAGKIFQAAIKELLNLETSLGFKSHLLGQGMSYNSIRPTGFVQHVDQPNGMSSNEGHVTVANSAHATQVFANPSNIVPQAIRPQIRGPPQSGLVVNDIARIHQPPHWRQKMPVTPEKGSSGVVGSTLFELLGKKA